MIIYVNVGKDTIISSVLRIQLFMLSLTVFQLCRRF